MEQERSYTERLSDRILLKKLEGKGAVLIQGPKWCGKTTSAEHFASSILYMDDPQNLKQNMYLADVNPQTLLLGDTPRLIDEWQIAPKLWDAVRFEVDHRRKMGQFILTGSAVPPDTSEIMHTGTGRFSWLTMRPMSLFESHDSTGQVSLANLFQNPERITGASAISINRLAFLTCRGGWPASLFMNDETALEQGQDYYDAVVNSDINRADGVQKNPERVKRLMRSFARNIGTQIANSVIADDIKINDGNATDIGTVASYINALKKIFVVEDMPSWNPNLRSKTAIRTSNTRYFVDPSIAVAALGLGPDDLIADLQTFGFLFECLCVRDLRVYTDVLGGQVYHYRDKTNLECDAVIHLRNGSYGLVEIKLGGDKLIEEGCQSLLKLSAKIDTDKMKAPSFLMVLTGVGNYAYKQKNGIYIVPVGCLRD